MSQKWPLYKQVVLLKDFPEYGLLAGNIATVVDFLEARRDLPNGYFLEAFNELGETIAVFIVNEDDIKLLTNSVY